MEQLIQRAVQLIHERYDDPLSLDDMARSAVMSKFHFLRMFRDATGVTPARFLSAVRLAHAKRLLRATDLNISDISVRVGYNSTGSFTRRFTESVGCSPAQYRWLGRREVGRTAVAEPHPHGEGFTIAGVVRSPRPDLSSICVGLFSGPIIERCPAASVVLDGPGPFRLEDVPAGTWYVHAVAADPDQAVGAGAEPRPLVDGVGPITTGRQSVSGLELTVRRQGWAHPPMLFALPPFGVEALAA